MFTCKNIKVSCRTIAGTAYILNEQSRELHMLDQVGTLIWDFINGESTIEEIVNSVLSEVEGDPDVVRDGVLRFINELADKELVLLSITEFKGVYVSAC